MLVYMKWKKLPEKNTLRNPVVAYIVGAIVMLMLNRLVNVKLLNPCD